MATTMRRVIELKLYPTQQQVVDRLNSFLMWDQITPEEYNELMLFSESVYNPPVVEEPVIEEQPVVTEPTE